MRNQLLYACVIALVACDGTRTGNPIGDDEATPPDAGNRRGRDDGFNHANCKATSSQLATLEQDAPLGFSAADILAFAQGEHETQIDWNAARDASGPEAGEHGLTVRIEPTDAKPRFVRYEQPDGTGSGRVLSADSCENIDSIEIDVTLEIKSDDGALDDKLKATLRAHTALSAVLGVAVDERRYLDLELSSLGVIGDVRGESESEWDADAGGNSVPAYRRGPLADIGAHGHCEQGYTIGLDQAVAHFDAQDAIDLVNGAQLALKWHDGSRTKLHAEFTSDSGPSCARIANEPTSAKDAVQLTLQGALRVSSDDDRIDGTWQGALVIANGAADGTLGDVRVVFGISNPMNAPIEDLVTKYGVHGVDASGYDDATVEFWLQFVAGATHDLTGGLRFSGLTQCAPAPTDAGSGNRTCETGRTTLDSATLSKP